LDLCLIKIAERRGGHEHAREHENPAHIEDYLLADRRRGPALLELVQIDLERRLSPRKKLASKATWSASRS